MKLSEISERLNVKGYNICFVLLYFPSIGSKNYMNKNLLFIFSIFDAVVFFFYQEFSKQLESLRMTTSAVIFS